MFDWFRKIRGKARSGGGLAHKGELEARRRFGTLEGGTRVAEHMIKRSIEPDYAEFIESREFFFIATSDRSGRCDCAFRAIDPEARGLGYPAIRVCDATTLLFPDLPGNGVYQSFGNLLVNPHIGLLFIDFGTARRARANGGAEILDDAEEAKRLFGPNALRMVRVSVHEIFANCPKYIPDLRPADPGG